MIKILLVYYSQTGEAERVVQAVTENLRDPEVDLTIEILQPKTKYPFPWRSIGRFFNVLPECHWGPVPALAPLQFDSDQHFDLVILVYQVWFLAPSLPMQSFLRSKEARVLRDTKVLTVSVCRNMWQSASETMKQYLRQHGARHMDNVVLTHQGPAWATFIATPVALLFGKKDGFWGVFPPVGLGSDELVRIGNFTATILDQKDKLIRAGNQPLLRNQGAVEVDVRYLLAERLGWYCFRWWGRLILALGRRGNLFRKLGVYLFVAFLVCIIPIGIPITMVIRWVFRPLLNRWMIPYKQRLVEPSDP